MAATGAVGRGDERRNIRGWLTLVVALTYVVGGWMVLLHHISGAQEHGEPSLVLHWLRDSTLALPLVGMAVAGSFLVARRVLAGAGTSRSETIARGALVGVGTAVALAAGNPLHEALFATHSGHGLPLVAHLGRDFLAAVPAAVLVAASLTAWLERPARPSRSGRIRRMTVAVTGGALLLSSLGGLTGTVAASATDDTGICPASAPVKTFDISAIDVDIPLNAFGDHDSAGKMYVLTDMIDEVRAQEDTQEVSIGLRNDPIQPLAIRANLGDCVKITFRNDASGGSYGVTIDGLAYGIDSAGSQVGSSPDSTVARGDVAEYTYWVPTEREIEGAHYLHPGPGNRDAVSHGLQGSLIVEPQGSIYLKPDADEELRSGWEARIVPGDPTKRTFREFYFNLHEVGDEDYRIPTTNGEEAGDTVPVVDPHTDAYRPASRAINYRSEPFMNRLDIDHRFESQAYGSYAFGDPSTPIARAYVGDPTKIRLVHGGSEMFHVYHLHGGGDRWRANPFADPTWNYGDTGLDKHPKTEKSASTRLDSQSVGPGESFNLEIEGGAGGVQQGAGDFLWHCHIAEHYLAGMWTFWRVFDTKQPDLSTMPDRAAPPRAVDSTELIGKTMLDGTTLTKDNIDKWVRPQLPPQGVKRDGFDATVWDWKVDTSNPTQPLYLGEPEMDQSTVWPNLPTKDGHMGAYPVDEFVGERPKILFNPINGRPAWPLLRPHLGQRPPFSPNEHSGAPYLGENGDVDPGGGVNPWAGRPDGICPAGSPVRTYNVVAISLPIQVTAAGGTDPNGKIFVLAEDKDAILAGEKPAEPLAIRANIGDCVAITFVQEIPDAADFAGFSKSNMHIHHVQFDTQASDGVISGASYEQSVRPYKAEDEQLTQAVGPGDTVLPLTSVDKFQEGVGIAVGQGENSIEIRTVAEVDPVNSTVTLDRPLKKAHAVDEFAGVEFVQYRWYPDVQLDNVFWHDHTDGIRNWGQGLVGQLLVEPRGSKYFDPDGTPNNGAGTYVTVKTDQSLADGSVNGSFREFVTWTIDDNLVTDSTINLRAEPWSDRLVDNPDPSLLFSSATHGDPYTPLPKAYPGDPFVMRTINVGPAVDSLKVDGHRFFYENRYTGAGGKPAASPVDTLRYGVSERYTLILQGGAGGVKRQPGDYIYANTVGSRFRQGAWGLIRVLNGRDPSIEPLPNNPAPSDMATTPAVTGGRPAANSDPGNPCPSTAKVRQLDVTAVNPSAGIEGQEAVFVESSDAAAVQNGTLTPEPLVLHAAAKECVKVNFTNNTTGRASFFASELLKATGSSGINAGFTPEQTIATGESRQYVFYADDARIGAVPITSWGGELGTISPPVPGDQPGDDVDIEQARLGMYGAIVVADQGAEFFDPETGEPDAVGSKIDVHLPDGSGYRDFALNFAERDATMGMNDMPYPTEVRGAATVNYQSAPRLNDTNGAFSGAAGTPLLRAYAGDPVRVHALLAPGSEQVQTFGLGGMSWPFDPSIEGSNEIGTQMLAPFEALDAHIAGGAGGRSRAVGDYFYGMMRRPFQQAGMWGQFEVTSDGSCPIQPLPGADCIGDAPLNGVPQPPPNAAPKITKRSASPGYISPNNDRKDDAINFSMRFSEPVDWNLQVRLRNKRVWSQSGSGGSLSKSWQGTRNGGAKAPAGHYTWRVTAVDGTGKSMRSPATGIVVVDRSRPVPRVLRVKRSVAASSGEKATVTYRLREPASVLVKVVRDGRVYYKRRVAYSTKTSLEAIRWNGRSGGRRAPGGDYQVTFLATDRAANQFFRKMGSFSLKW